MHTGHRLPHGRHVGVFGPLFPGRELAAIRELRSAGIELPGEPGPAWQHFQGTRRQHVRTGRQLRHDHARSAADPGGFSYQTDLSPRQTQAAGCGAFPPEMRPAGQRGPGAVGIPAYFAHADSPSAQGINEKTGRLRRYIPQKALTSLITSAISRTWPTK